MRKHSVRIGLIQTKVSEDVERNLGRTAEFIKPAAQKGADVVCLQELFAQRYFAQVKSKKFFETAESVPGPTSNFLSECAKANRVVLVGGSFYEHGGDGKY